MVENWLKLVESLNLSNHFAWIPTSCAEGVCIIRHIDHLYNNSLRLTTNVAKAVDYWLFVKRIYRSLVDSHQWCRKRSMAWRRRRKIVNETVSWQYVDVNNNKHCGGRLYLGRFFFTTNNSPWSKRNTRQSYVYVYASIVVLSRQVDVVASGMKTGRWWNECFVWKKDIG